MYGLLSKTRTSPVPVLNPFLQVLFSIGTDSLSFPIVKPPSFHILPPKQRKASSASLDCFFSFNNFHLIRTLRSFFYDHKRRPSQRKPRQRIARSSVDRILQIFLPIDIDSFVLFSFSNQHCGMLAGIQYISNVKNGNQ